MQIKGKSVITLCVCGRIKKHGVFIPITKEISQNIKMFVEKGIMEIERKFCPDCEKGREE